LTRERMGQDLTSLVRHFGGSSFLFKGEKVAVARLGKRILLHRGKSHKRIGEKKGRLIFSGGKKGGGDGSEKKKIFRKQT